ncbi:hypothetical protein N7532_006035 [Penicillium argentinense]|uniref:Uncharacterized protein n=1 Tax=Penicillium argentinense TaxID=1131581 RepID=A0A9W9FFB1_9EURO|nr:uncharacterized protein N7532_006035 [Penicillium argentinense]KAJ5099034.1 hypothetical protein N7532_006035 [Penicillium argentinense]
MDQEEAPPPYSAVDPLLAPAANRNSNAAQTAVPLRANVSVSPEAGSSSSAASPVVPTHFTSAATYFEQRPPTVVDESRALLHHHMTIYPRSQAKDFPRRPRCWAMRMNEIAQQDWDTFLKYLFPPQLGLAAASQHLPRQLRAEIQRDRKDRPQETDEQRRARIAAVVDEWNQCFFELRGTRIISVYVGEPDAAPTSALCPRCYPAATKATSGTGSIASPDPRAQNAPEPVAGQPAPSLTSWPIPPMPMMPHGPPSPFGVPFGAPQFPRPGASPTHQPPQYYPQPPPGTTPWGPWNNWSYAQPQYTNTGSGKSGTFGWISDLASKAQKYGDRFAEQAEQYGNQLSSHAMHYGRQFEEQALAHGRWLEEQARLHGRKQPAYQGYPPAIYANPNPYPGWSPSPTSGPGSTPATPTSNLTPTSQPTAPPTTQPNLRNKDDDKSSIEQSRRASITSTSSESSLSSIDTISTTSDLSASDLANVRTQLQDLDDRHDRILYDAAVDLRRQLQILQESRREARASGRRNWLPGTRPQQSQPTDSNDWGRWESPEQQQRASIDRRAMKEEMRATRKAFRDVVRRARDEQRARRRVKRNRRRHGPQTDDKAKEQLALDGSMKNLALNHSTPAIAHTQTMPVAQPQPQRVPMRSETSSEFSGRSNMNTPSSVSQASVHELPADSSDKKPKSGRIKDMLKPRSKKRDEDKSKKDGAS